MPCGTAWALRPGGPDARPAQRASCGGALANTWTRPLFAAAFCTLVGKEAGEGQGNAGKHETQVLRLPKIMDVEDVSKLLAQFVGHSFLTASGNLRLALQTLRAGKSRGLEAFWHRCCARFAEKVPRLLANWCLLGGAGLASCIVSTRLAGPRTRCCRLFRALAHCMRLGPKWQTLKATACLESFSS